MSEKVGVCISIDKTVRDSADAVSDKLGITRSKLMEMAIVAGLPNAEQAFFAVFPPVKREPPIVLQPQPAVLEQRAPA